MPPQAHSMEHSEELAGWVISYANKQEQFIGHRMAPGKEVRAEQGEFHVFDADYNYADETAITDAQHLRSAGAPFNYSKRKGASTTSYQTEEYGQAGKVDRKDISAAMRQGGSVYDVEKMEALKLAAEGMIHNEINVATKVADTTQYGTSSHYTTNSGTSQWDSSGSYPFTQLLEFADVLDDWGLPEEEVWLMVPRKPWRTLREHSDTMDHMKYSFGPDTGRVPTKNDIISALGFKGLLRGRSNYNALVAGQTMTGLTGCWDDHVWMGSIVDSPDPMDQGFLHTMVFDGDLSGLPLLESDGPEFKSAREPWFDMVAHHNVDWITVKKYHGCVIKDATS